MARPCGEVKAMGSVFGVPEGGSWVISPVVASATKTLPMESTARAEGLVKVPRVVETADVPEPIALAANFRMDLLLPSAT